MMHLKKHQKSIDHTQRRREGVLSGKVNSRGQCMCVLLINVSEEPKKKNVHIVGELMLQGTKNEV
jgi:hypothetical protein